MKNVFLQLWQKKCFDVNGSDSFKGIIGHNDIKKIFNKAVISKKPVHILLVGSPGSAKTSFILNINRILKGSLFVTGSNTTKAGLINQLFETKPKFLLVDELEKMNRADQISLLHLMETVIISETKSNKTRQMVLSSSVFASANSCDKIIEPLLSRFVVLKIPEYTFREFKEIVMFRLAKEGIQAGTAERIANSVWLELKSRNVRDAIKISRLATKPEDIEDVVKVLKNYRDV
jgi:Holliday junction DNA helicase RuvB